MSAYTPDCIRPKVGQTMQHCRECHQTFSGTSAGDSHRTGKHEVRTGPDRRRCRTEAEMVAVGLWRDARGLWRGEASRTGAHRRWSGLAGSGVTVQASAEPGALPMDPEAA